MGTGMCAEVVRREAGSRSQGVIPVGIPSLTLQVIGVGFGRTGILSLREALVRLGFGPCDHMIGNFEKLDRFSLWAEALRQKEAGEPIDWRPLLDDYRAIVDWPGTYFWRELVAAHPEAKVILTVRAPARWYESCLATIFRLSAMIEHRPVVRHALNALGRIVPPLRHGLQVTNGAIWDGTFDGRFIDRQYALHVFEQHDEDVRRMIPAEQLLVFSVSEGWLPLCSFLGVAAPDGEPFPHVNDAPSFWRRLRNAVVRGALLLTGVVSVGAIGVRVVKSIRGRRRGTIRP